MSLARRCKKVPPTLWLWARVQLSRGTSVAYHYSLCIAAFLSNGRPAGTVLLSGETPILVICSFVSQTHQESLMIMKQLLKNRECDGCRIDTSDRVDSVSRISRVSSVPCRLRDGTATAF